MSPRRPLEAAKVAELAVCLGPSMLAEAAPKPDSLTLAAWHAMNALQRVAELLPDADRRARRAVRELWRALLL